VKRLVEEIHFSFKLLFPHWTPISNHLDSFFCEIRGLVDSFQKVVFLICQFFGLIREDLLRDVDEPILVDPTGPVNQLRLLSPQLKLNRFGSFPLPFLTFIILLFQFKFLL
jgi:hypothetical protein